MNCPKCGSDNTRKYKEVYNEGAYTAETEAQITGPDGIAVGTGNISEKSNLAEKCSPPRKKSPTARLLIWLVFPFIVVIIALAVFNIQLRDDATDLVALLLILIGIPAWSVFQAIEAHKFNKEEYPRLLAAWEDKWICLKCGESFSESAQRKSIDRESQANHDLSSSCTSPPSS